MTEFLNPLFCWHTMRKVFIITAIVLISMSCNQHIGNNEHNDPIGKNPERGIYHWKTTFDLSSEDTLFIHNHNIKTIYIRMFDVGMDVVNGIETNEVVPLGTTRFITCLPKGCSLVPTVYITLKALKQYNGREHELADLVIKRVFAMCSWNELGDFDELQYDCDWTLGTKTSYERLCNYSREILSKKGVILSGTIRLHQIEEATYPFDKGVLMMYNTGSFVNPNTKNSILDYDDVYKYLSVDKRIDKFCIARRSNCPIIEIAFPTYSWGVVFNKSGEFKRLTNKPYGCSLDAGETIRIEQSSYSEIMRVKSLVNKSIGRIASGHIIYHLDSDNLKSYECHEIENILN